MLLFLFLTAVTAYHVTDYNSIYGIKGVKKFIVFTSILNGLVLTILTSGFISKIILTTRFYDYKKVEYTLNPIGDGFKAKLYRNSGEVEISISETSEFKTFDTRNLDLITFNENSNRKILIKKYYIRSEFNDFISPLLGCSIFPPPLPEYTLEISSKYVLIN